MTRTANRRKRFAKGDFLYRVGKDEMNLLETSVSGASRRADKSIEELVFERSTRGPDSEAAVTQKLTMSFSSKYGRPTVEDDEIYVALQAITRELLEQGHESPRIPFTRYQVVQVLSWPRKGQNYTKIDNAINRLGGVYLVYENAFYDKSEKSWVDARFHLIDESHLFTREKYDVARSSSGKRPKSWIRWGEPLFKSFRDGNFATFDLDVYRAIRSGVGKKLYRYSEKRLWQKQRYVEELRTLAEQRLGFKEGQYLSELRRCLEPVFEELGKVGVKVRLEPNGDSTNVHVHRLKARKKPGGRPDSAHGQEDAAELNSASSPELALIKRGVSPERARLSVRDLPAERIELVIDVFDWEMKRGTVIHNSGGWIYAACKAEGWKPPGEYKSKAERAAEAVKEREREEAKAREKADEQKRREQTEASKAEVRAKLALFRAYYAELPVETQARARGRGFAENATIRAGAVQEGPQKGRRWAVASGTLGRAYSATA